MNEVRDLAPGAKGEKATKLTRAVEHRESQDNKGVPIRWLCGPGVCFAWIKLKLKGLAKSLRGGKTSCKLKG